MKNECTLRVSKSVMGWSETPLGTLRATISNVTFGYALETALLADSIFTGFVLATQTFNAAIPEIKIYTL
jgi:hypothetical protein